MDINPQDERWSALSPEQQALVRKLVEERLRNVGAGMPSAQPASEIIPLPRTDALPLSFAQQRLWFFNQLVAGSPVYNSPITADLRGPLDCNLLLAALQQAVYRHDVFRTAFRSQGGQPVCSIAPAAPLDVMMVDLSALPADQQEAEVRAIILAEAAYSFDLGRPPLIRIALISREPERHVLLVNVHHIVCDGQSEALLFQDVQTIYNAAIQQQQPLLPPMPIQYVDFAAWQRQSAPGDLAYWSAKLAGAPPMIALNTHYASGRGFSFEGYTYSFLLPPTLRTELHTWSKQTKVMPFATLFAAFEMLLHYLSGQTDLVVGTLVDDRPVPDTERLVGLFLNPLPIRANCADDPSFTMFAQRIQQALWEAIEHRHTPFEQIVAQVLPAHDRSLYPIFNVLISQEVRPRLDLHGTTAELRFWDNDNGTSKYDLSLAILEDEGETLLNFACNVAVFDQETLAQFAEIYRALLQQIPMEADRKLSELRPNLSVSLTAPLKSAPPQAPAIGAREDAATPSADVAAGIVAIWSEVLTVDANQIDLDTSFFELGGHSLLALQVIAHVLEHFQSMLPADTFEFEGKLLNALFEEPTVRTMALMVEEALAAEIERMSEDEVRQILDITED